MSAPGGKPPARGRPSLIAAAKASSSAGTNTNGSLPFSAQPPTGSSSVAPSTRRPPPATLAQAGRNPSQASSSTFSARTPALSFPLQRAPTTSSQDSGSNRSTPTLPDATSIPSTPLPGQPVQRLKFRAKAPTTRVKQVIEVKPEPAQSAAARGGFRGRGVGRGGVAGRGGRPPFQSAPSIAAGPLGGQRAADVYSDDEDEEGGLGSRNIIDIGAISGLGESAPTSLIRAGRETGKASGKVLDSKSARKLAKEAKRRSKSSGKDKGKARDTGDVAGEDGMDIDIGVKSEPLSPEKLALELHDEEEYTMRRDLPRGFPGHAPRTDDVMMDEDMSQDRDEAGRRLRMTAGGAGGVEGSEESEEVNEGQKVDLSESESEEEEGDMEGDFVHVDGLDDPSTKLYTFQFPHLFPHFISPAPIDLSAEQKPDVKPDIKPSAAQLNGTAGVPGRKRRPAQTPPGRVGSLVVMKSGKVKMVMGNDIVMNVSPGVPSTFLQQLIHLDAPHKSTTVLGEVNKHFVVTPDIDRLLNELWLNDGTTPGDRAREVMRIKKEQQLPEGLVKMEDV